MDRKAGKPEFDGIYQEKSLFILRNYGQAILDALIKKHYGVKGFRNTQQHILMEEADIIQKGIEEAARREKAEEEKRNSRKDPVVKLQPPTVLVKPDAHPTKKSTNTTSDGENREVQK